MQLNMTAKHVMLRLRGRIELSTPGRTRCSRESEGWKWISIAFLKAPTTRNCINFLEKGDYD